MRTESTFNGIKFPDDPRAEREHGSPGRVLAHAPAPPPRPAAPAPKAAPTRTAELLRDILFDEIDALREGRSDTGRAQAIGKLASQIVNVTRLEIENARLVAENPLLANRPALRLGSGE